jgi:hypothetical protein
MNGSIEIVRDGRLTLLQGDHVQNSQETSFRFYHGAIERRDK